MERIKPSRPSGLRSGCALPAPGRTRPAPAAALRCPESPDILLPDGTAAVPGPDPPFPESRKPRLPAICAARAPPSLRRWPVLHFGMEVGIRKGFRVAVCEQVEDSADAKERRTPRSLLRRAVVRLLTPGTITEDSLLEARRHNFLASYCEVRGEGALVWADISTGSFRVMACSRTLLSPQLARITPREVLVPETAEADLLDIIADIGASATPLPRTSFDSTSAERRLTGLFNIGSLDAFGTFSRPETGAMGAIVDYLDLTQKGRLPLLRPPIKERLSSFMQIDVATRRNLELTQALDGGKEGSLLSSVDRTVTAGGGRLLERRLSCPSLDLEAIRRRLDAVEYFTAERALSNSLRRHLRQIPDLDRALSRLSLDRGRPKGSGSGP